MSSRDDYRSGRSSYERSFHRSPGHRRSLDDKRRTKGRSPERRRPEEDRRYRNHTSLSSSPRRRRRRNRFSYDDYSDDSRRNYRRSHRSSNTKRGGNYNSSSRSPSRRRGNSPHRRGGYDEQGDIYRRRSRRSSLSQEICRRGRRRKRRRIRHRSHSSNSPRPLPLVAVPRAGVVSDDDDGAANQVGTEATIVKSSKNHDTNFAAIQKRSSSSSHDDTIGHFKGRDGTIIADRFRILREVGVGTFGRVLECLNLKRSRSNRRDKASVVAIKIVRNVKRYYESALIEADIIEDVNRRGGRGVSHCAVMYDAFTFEGHYCMVFESLGPSLYDFLKSHKYQPFPLLCVRDFARQLLETLEFFHSFRLIHTDLKPENILLLNHREVNYRGFKIPECTRIKVIDFGGATYDNEKKSSVVNTRQYRAPEVILGVGWSTPSDLWSIGCILAELYQGELLFATHDNTEHLALIEQVIGPFPRRLLNRAKNEQLANQAFDSTGAHRMERTLAPESLAYVKRVGPLESLVYQEDKWFLRLLRRILVTDPDERATARECLRKF